jgi:hypothetical protein
MAVQDDVTAARRAVQALVEAVAGVTRHYSDTVDVRRLKADIGRLHDDLDLLCGSAVPNQPAPPPRPLEVIADSDYTHDFWMDAEDEGLGRADYRPDPQR